MSGEEVGGTVRDAISAGGDGGYMSGEGHTNLYRDGWYERTLRMEEFREKSGRGWVAGAFRLYKLVSQEENLHHQHRMQYRCASFKGGRQDIS